ncbi:MAG: tetratricopeptide repeat protein [Burkholderiales bacterium]|uniref:tetratricopeptide repeat protein n=1 Tax=Inhella sp. TaxID=1921806 RepID=UPI001ACF3CBB|nr:tetratricopeptide repeat protein [Burkholderiales bacterium]
MRAALLLICCFLLPFAGKAQALEQAHAHWYAGRQSQAIETLDLALRDNPQQARWRFTLAWMLQERGELGRAEGLLRALIEDFPDLAEAHNNLAVLLAGRGDLDAALVALQRAVQLQPDHVQAQENLGDVLMRMAQRAYLKATQTAPPRAALSLKLRRLSDWLNTTPE